MATPVDDDIRAILGRAATNGHVLRLPENLPRRQFAAVDAILTALGARGAGPMHGYVFPDLARFALEQLLMTGTIPDEPQDLLLFETPPDLARLVIAAAEIEDGQEVLEPSAGAGALAMPAFRAGGCVDCIEVDPRWVRHLERGPYRSVMQADFLGERPRRSYDRVVMTPPFLWQRDFDHVRQACRFLKPGGRLAAIVGDGLLFRMNRQGLGLKRLVEAGAGTTTVLPKNGFAASNTTVRAALITIEATAALIRHLQET